MKPSIQLRLAQHLALTPQLQQSIRLLQLSTLELNQELEQALMDNPLLERDDDPLAGHARLAADGSIVERDRGAAHDDAHARFAMAECVLDCRINARRGDGESQTDQSEQREGGCPYSPARAASVERVRPHVSPPSKDASALRSVGSIASALPSR